jgi:energy-coupling factor transporter ATP-binding protein EcfA2
VYIERLVLSEFRAIARSDIEFTQPMAPGAGSLELPNINLLVGTNGGGKSTILKAIAAGVLGDQVDLIELTGGSVLSWPRLGATGSSYARVTSRATGGEAGPSSTSVHETLVEIDSTGVRHSGDEELDSDAGAISLFGYGPQRLASRDLTPGSGDDPVGRVASLFEWRQQLHAAESWLPEVDAGTLAAINFLMPPETRLTGGLAGDEVEVESRGLAVARSMLSDGAQSYMAWMLDLVFRLIRTRDTDDFRDVRGTVLVDEVDQRMHPRWQQSVLRTLSDGLPNLQFICSAHSPLLAGGLRPENLTVLEPDHNAPGEGAMKASHFEEDLYGRTADGVLTSSYFNLPSSRSDDFRQQLRRLADAAATMDQEAIDFIRMLSAGSDDDIRVRSELIQRPDRLRRRR